MKISVIHASRGRPERAEESMRKMMVAASGNIEYEYILVYDEDDPQAAKYAAITAPKLTKYMQPEGKVTRRSIWHSQIHRRFDRLHGRQCGVYVAME